MISNVNEIPNLNYKDEILQRLIFGPIILEHQNFIWNIDYIDSVRSRGTMVFSFTSILQSKHTMSSLLRTKFTSNVIGSVLYSNGWKFLNFGDYELELKSDTKIPLSDGGYKLASDITPDDDINDDFIKKYKK